MSLGQLIDELYELRAKRLGLTKQVDALKEDERERTDAIMHMLNDTGLGAARGAIATAALHSSKKPIVADWTQVYKYIVDNNRFDLLHQRISSLAWAELEKDGILVPGTEAFTDISLSLTKAKR